MRPSFQTRRFSRRSRSTAFAAAATLLAMAALAAGVWAAYSGNTNSSGNQLLAAPDWVAPTASSSVVGKSEGGVPGYIRQGGGYYVYASVADSGAPPSGIASVSFATPGLNATPLSPGSFPIGGTSYNYRSAVQPAPSPTAAGTYGYSLNSTDVAGNSRSQSGYSVVVDNTAPTAADIQTTNKTANTVGRPEIGDSIVFTFSEPIDANSILAGWTGAATSVVVRISNVTNDPLTVFNASDTSQLPLGSVSLGRSDYVSASATFGKTGTASTMVQSGNAITITLGTASSGPTTASGNGTMIWSPSTSAYDWAGNPMSATTRSESGSADKEF